MTEQYIKKDKHFPTFVMSNFVRKLFEKPDKHNIFVEPNQVVADLGCGPGYFTLSMAGKTGPQGCVYAVDSDEKVIRAVEKKAAKRSLANIEAHTSSAADLEFIADASVDFVLADGLLCCVAPQEHNGTVNEIKRILKPTGRAYLLTERSRMSYVDDREWENILKEFKVEERNIAPYRAFRWALVSRQSP